MGHMIKIQVDGYFNHHRFEEISLNWRKTLCNIFFCVPLLILQPFWKLVYFEKLLSWM